MGAGVVFLFAASLCLAFGADGQGIMDDIARINLIPCAEELVKYLLAVATGRCWQLPSV